MRTETTNIYKKQQKSEEKANTCAAQKKTAHLVVIVSEAESATNKCASLPFDRSPKLKVLLILYSNVFKYFTSRSSDVSCVFWWIFGLPQQLVDVSIK